LTAKFSNPTIWPARTPGGADEASVRAGFWRTFAKAAKQVPFAEDVVAAYYCALDPETPGKAKAVLLGALAYFIMPMDAVPDFWLLSGFPTISRF
jgi:uncharacterized membrane protein YkvA (DUF1232 family)